MTRRARPFGVDHRIRHPHDLGSRACPARNHQDGHQVINPDITPLCRGLGLCLAGLQYMDGRTPRGTLLRRDYYNREIWRPAITAAGLPSDTT